MLRYVLFTLLALVLLVPFVTGRIMNSASNGNPDPDSLRLVIVSPHNVDIRSEFGRAFDAWHNSRFGKHVRVEFLPVGGTNDIKRYLDSIYRLKRDQAGKLLPADQVNADIDMVWGGGDFFFDVELKNGLGVLQPMKLSPELLKATFPNPTLSGVKLYDFAPDKVGNPLPPSWVGVCMSSFGIVYNPDVFQQMKLSPPSTWSDLTDRRLAGQIALANPLSSGSAAIAYSMVFQRAMADREREIFKAHPALATKELKPVLAEAIKKFDLNKCFGPTEEEKAGKLAPEVLGKLQANRAALAANRADVQAYVEALATGWHEGMGRLLLIAANARYFTDSATQPPADVGTGDASAGIAIDFYGRVYEEIVGSNRIKFVAPKAATAQTPDPVAILYGVKGQSLQTATRFVEFLLSDEGQRLWITQVGKAGGPVHRALRRPPIKTSLYKESQTDWTDHANPFEDAGGFNQRQEWAALNTDIRLLWACSWIDSREELKSCYRTILQVPSPETQTSLLARLVDLPISYPDVIKLQAERKAAEADKTVDSWRARKRIQLGLMFREHYRSIEADARGAVPQEVTSGR